MSSYSPPPPLSWTEKVAVGVPDEQVTTMVTELASDSKVTRVVTAGPRATSPVS